MLNISATKKDLVAALAALSKLSSQPTIIRLMGQNGAAALVCEVNGMTAWATVPAEVHGEDTAHLGAGILRDVVSGLATNVIGLDMGEAEHPHSPRWPTCLHSGWWSDKTPNFGPSGMDYTQETERVPSLTITAAHAKFILRVEQEGLPTLAELPVIGAWQDAEVAALKRLAGINVRGYALSDSAHFASVTPTGLYSSDGYAVYVAPVALDIQEPSALPLTSLKALLKLVSAKSKLSIQAAPNGLLARVDFGGSDVILHLPFKADAKMWPLDALRSFTSTKVPVGAFHMDKDKAVQMSKLATKYHEDDTFMGIGESVCLRAFVYLHCMGENVCPQGA